MSDNGRDKTTIIETGGRDRGSSGTIIAVVLVIALLALLYFLFGDRLTGAAESTDIKVDVSAPATPSRG